MDTKIHASQLSLGLLAICCFLGFCSTFLIPEPTGLSLEETAAMFFDLDEDENDMMDKDPEGNGAVDYPVFADEFSGYTAPAQGLGMFTHSLQKQTKSKSEMASRLLLIFPPLFFFLQISHLWEGCSEV